MIFNEGDFSASALPHAL